MFHNKAPVSIFSVRSGKQYKPAKNDDLKATNSTSLYDSALREDGLMPGTMVAAADGWRPVESIQPGECVMTFDNGMREVVENRRISLSYSTIPKRKTFVMHIPCGALANRSDMTLMPMQEVIIESDKAELTYGDPFVLMPSLLLTGYRGISKTPVTGDIILSMLLFEREQVVQTNGGLLTLAHAHSSLSPLTMATPNRFDRYLRLTPAQLRGLIDWEQPSEQPGPAFAGQSVDAVHAALEARAS